VLSQSDKVRYSRSATGATRPLRTLFCSIKTDPTSRALCDRKRAEGKRHHQALIALARRKVNVLYAMLRDREPYRPQPSPAERIHSHTHRPVPLPLGDCHALLVHALALHCRLD
jgi:hypothetical protein